MNYDQFLGFKVTLLQENADNTIIAMVPKTACDRGFGFTLSLPDNVSGGLLIVEMIYADENSMVHVGS